MKLRPNLCRSLTGWLQDGSTLTGSESSFGHAVSIGGSLLLVGAPNESPQGKAYLYQRINGNWTHVNSLVTDGTGTAPQVGRAVALGGDNAVVGAPGDDDTSEDPPVVQVGSALIFEDLPATCP